MSRYKAICLKEIYWGGKIYREGSLITVDVADVDSLRNAGVVGNIRKVEVETATRSAPENAAKKYKKTKRGSRK